MFSAMGLSELDLGICLRRVNGSGASKPSVLGGSGAESSSSGVDENPVALLDFVRLVHERGDRRCCMRPAASIRVSIWNCGGWRCIPRPRLTSSEKIG